MLCTKCFGILVEVEGVGGIADIAGIAEIGKARLTTDNDPESGGIAESHVWDKFAVSLQGCTSNPTPNWDDLG